MNIYKKTKNGGAVKTDKDFCPRNGPKRFAELQIIFTVVSVFTKENFNPFSNLISPFGIGTHEIKWLFSIFLTHNWSPIYLLS